MSASHLSPLPLPDGITEDYIHCPSNGLTFHILEAGRTRDRDRPLIVLCHGFPELAFSWRKIMSPLADAGYHVVAFDQRGYGRTTGWDNSSFINTNLSQFALTNVVRDVVTLVNALGYRQVKSIVGHDFGAVTASMCALMRPDFFRSVVMMSHPFKAPEPLPFNTAHLESQPRAAAPPRDNTQAELARLAEPRKHYKWYNSTSTAAIDWANPAQGLHQFLRGYIHVKSAAWQENTPHPLSSWTAQELAKLPFYYIMPLQLSMPETIANMVTSQDMSATESWMPDSDLAVYVEEWSRTGFQGGLNYYRITTDPNHMKDLELFAGKKIECPSAFISGANDWGNYQQPGALESYPDSCSDFRGSRFIKDAGHWPQQEQPEKVVQELLAFLHCL